MNPRPPKKSPPWPAQPQIEFWMRKQGFNYSTLAEALGWPAWQDVQKILQGWKRLRWEHVMDFSRVLGVHPLRLAPLLATLEDDVRPMEEERSGLRSNTRKYVVTNPVVEDGGLKKGDVISVAPIAPEAQQIVLAAIAHPDREKPFLMLFQWLPPGSIVTYRRGFIVGMKTDDPEYTITVLGVVMDAFSPEGNGPR